MKTFKTPKGTELSILNLRGKDYLEVNQRIIWFREIHPDWSIETEPRELNENFAIVKATIKNEHGRIMAQAHKREDQKHFADYMEKCETSAIGRALALCGFGTQFCADELDEGQRIVDAPLQRQSNLKVVNEGQPTQAQGIGDFVVQISKKYKGMTLNDIGLDDVKSFSKWLTDQAKTTGKPLSGQALEFVNAAKMFEEEQMGQIRF